MKRIAANSTSKISMAVFNYFKEKVRWFYLKAIN